MTTQSSPPLQESLGSPGRQNPAARRPEARRPEARRPEASGAPPATGARSSSPQVQRPSRMRSLAPIQTLSGKPISSSRSRTNRCCPAVRTSARRPPEPPEPPARHRLTAVNQFTFNKQQQQQKVK